MRSGWRVPLMLCARSFPPHCELKCSRTDANIIRLEEGGLSQNSTQETPFFSCEELASVLLDDWEIIRYLTTLIYAICDQVGTYVYVVFFCGPIVQFCFSGAGSTFLTTAMNRSGLTEHEFTGFHLKNLQYFHKLA